MNILKSLLAVVLIGWTAGCGNSNPGSNVTPGGNAPAVPVPGSTASAFQLSNDPFTDTTAQHATAVEPSIAANGNHLVSVFQVGRIQSGASDAIGFATSSDGGQTWTRGIIPGLTSLSGGAATLLNVTDGVVAWDAMHSMWLVVSLNFTNTQSSVVISRSSDGLNWNAPITVSTGANFDKTWIACDNGASSSHRGTCYAEWDDINNGQRILISRSTDGGVTWQPAVSSADNATGIAGQFAIQPTGHVIMPFFNSSSSNPEIMSLSSGDGGDTWSGSTLISAVQFAKIPTRGETDPTVTVDSNGKVYVSWYDCRFENGCSANDLVFTSSTDGVTWPSAQKIAIPTTGLNLFLPTLNVNPADPANLTMLYYQSSSGCTGNSCQISPELSISHNSGETWSAPQNLWSAFSVSAIASSSEGPMVGDYLSLAFVGNTAFPVFAVAITPVIEQFNEEIVTTPVAVAP